MCFRLFRTNLRFLRKVEETSILIQLLLLDFDTRRQLTKLKFCSSNYVTLKDYWLTSNYLSKKLDKTMTLLVAWYSILFSETHRVSLLGSLLYSIQICICLILLLCIVSLAPQAYRIENRHRSLSSPKDKFRIQSLLTFKPTCLMSIHLRTSMLLS